MALKQANVDVALPSAARTATAQSSAVAAPGAAAHCVLMVHATVVTGTGPTLVGSLEQSPDQSTWTAIAGSSTAQLAAAGNALSTAIVTDDYVRAVLTIGGTSPSFTCSASVLIASE